MYLYKKGNCIIIWQSYLTRQQYFDYPVNEAKKHYKLKYNTKGFIKKVNFCPFLFN
jgi:uncharacterized protein involved in cysteine biosynthesis